MKYGLKTVEESRNELKEGDLIVSITNNCRLTKGKTYKVYRSFWNSGVVNDKGEFVSDMSLFVFEYDWKKAMRDVKLRKLGI